jgi:hypothetical protein
VSVPEGGLAYLRHSWLISTNDLFEIKNSLFFKLLKIQQKINKKKILKIGLVLADAWSCL